MLLKLEQAYATDAFIAMVTGRKLGKLFTKDGPRPRKVIAGEFELKVRPGINKEAQLRRLESAMDKANATNAAALYAGKITLTVGLLTENNSIAPKAFRQADNTDRQSPKLGAVAWGVIATQPR